MTESCWHSILGRANTNKRKRRPKLLGTISCLWDCRLALCQSKKNDERVPALKYLFMRCSALIRIVWWLIKLSWLASLKHGTIWMFYSSKPETARGKVNELNNVPLNQLTDSGHSATDQHEYDAKDQRSASMPKASWRHLAPYDLHVPCRSGCGMGSP